MSTNHNGSFPKPSILLAHNFYQQPGGEDRVVTAERSLLSSAGHRVVDFFRHNSELSDLGNLQVAMVGLQAIWSQGVRDKLRNLLATERPSLAHCHNTMPLLSPSIYYACRDAGIPVVQTIHNYRLLCPSGVLYRDNKVCEDCVGKNYLWPAVIHGCYRDSRASSAALATMLSAHRALGTWHNAVDLYITPSHFARRKLIEAGLPEHKIVVKPHFVPEDPGVSEGEGEFVLFIGRLSQEKGVDTLLEAWRRLAAEVPLLIIGDGPLAEKCKSMSGRVLSLGFLERSAIWQYLKRARFVVVPSECYETFGLSIIEAFSCGVPVVASDRGSPGELVTHNVTGLKFESGNPEDLAAKVEWAWSHPEETKEMRIHCRSEYEDKYTAEMNYSLLQSIYMGVLGASSPVYKTEAAPAGLS